MEIIKIINTLQMIVGKYKLNDEEAKVIEQSIEIIKPKYCIGCIHNGKWENEYEYGLSCPCLRCVRRCQDNFIKEKMEEFV